MQLKPNYIDISDLVITEFDIHHYLNGQNTYQLPEVDSMSSQSQIIENQLFFEHMDLTPQLISLGYEDYTFSVFQIEENSNQDADQSSFQRNDPQINQFEVVPKVLSKKEINLQQQGSQQKMNNSRIEGSQNSLTHQKSECRQTNDSVSQVQRIPENCWVLQPRNLKIERYLRKKQRRLWGTQKRYIYKCRKTVASFRLRVKGKFINKMQAQKILERNLDDLTTQEIKEKLNNFYQTSNKH